MGRAPADGVSREGCVHTDRHVCASIGLCACTRSVCVCVCAGRGALVSPSRGVSQGLAGFLGADCCWLEGHNFTVGQKHTV